MRRMLVVLLSACAAVVAAPAAGAAAPAWTTYRHDATRSGIDPDSSNPVTPTAAWQTPALDGKIYGQPLVYGSRVYVATENDTIYALDAATGAVAWSAHLATPENASTAPCGDISPTIGITSTPVIDPRTNRIYAVGAVATAAGPVHELFAVDLASGQAVAGFPVNADPPGANPAYQLQRPALALVNGRVLAGYGGNNGDCGTYWGWLVSLATAPPRGEASFQADPHSHGGAVWGSGTGPAVDAASHVWVTTGNGFGTSSFDFSESVVELDSVMHPLAYWAPTNWHTLDSSDTDLSSSQPVLLPHGLVLQSGKDGNAYVVNAASPGGVSSPVVSMHFCPGGSFGGSVYLAATSTIYAACSSGLKAMTLGLGAGTPTLALKPGFAAPGDAIGPPVIAGNLVWVVAWSSGRALGLDPTTGAVSFQAQLPAVEHFATPSAGGGRLFLGAGTQVLAFTIATPQPPLPPSGSPPPPPAPRLFRARLVPRRFRAGRSATLTLVLSRAATVTVTIDQLRRGHRPLRRLRRTFNAHAGRHSFRLRLGRLRPGSYRATATAVAARRTSAPVRVSFTVLRRR